ncbi:MAG: hypothetical protein ACI8PT_000040 [Gammaproteobacteria bacterium]|jgi:hypothetical protein
MTANARELNFASGSSRCPRLPKFSTGQMSVYAQRESLPNDDLTPLQGHVNPSCRGARLRSQITQRPTIMLPLAHFREAQTSDRSTKNADCNAFNHPVDELATAIGSISPELALASLPILAPLATSAGVPAPPQVHANRRHQDKNVP